MASYTTAFPTNEDPLSEGGVWDSAYTPSRILLVTSNKVRPKSLGLRSYATVTTPTFANNQNARIKIATLNDSSVEAGGPLLRFTASDTRNGYAFQAWFGGNRHNIVRVDGGTDTIINSDNTAGTPVAGDTIIGDATGTTLSYSAILGGTPTNNIVQQVDGNYTSGRVGIVMANDGVSLTDFDMDDFDSIDVSSTGGSKGIIGGGFGGSGTIIG